MVELPKICWKNFLTLWIRLSDKSYPGITIRKNAKVMFLVISNPGGHWKNPPTKFSLAITWLIYSKIFFSKNVYSTGEQLFQKHQILHSNLCTRFCPFWEVKIFQKIHSMIYMLFLNKPENFLKKVQTRGKKGYAGPWKTVFVPLH